MIPFLSVHICHTWTYISPPKYIPKQLNFSYNNKNSDNYFLNWDVIGIQLL